MTKNYNLTGQMIVCKQNILRTRKQQSLVNINICKQLVSHSKAQHLIPKHTLLPLVLEISVNFTSTKHNDKATTDL